MRLGMLVASVGVLALLGVARADEDERPEDPGVLLQALPKARVSLADGIKQAAKAPAVVTPDVHDRRPGFVVLVASKGKVQDLTYDLTTGAETKPAKVKLGSR